MNNHCIETTYRKDRRGYGDMWFDGRLVKHHRYVYCKHHGVSLTSIATLVVRHTCDNPSCVNPKHLELGTHQDNMNDMKSRDRQPKGETHHRAKLTDAQVAEIRELARRQSQVEIAKTYGVSQWLVSQIVNNKVRPA